jgi:hypothetical protein
LDRSRLCDLAGVERGKHIRWTKLELLPNKPMYGEFDLIRAAAFDELSRVLKPALAKTAWHQVEPALGLAKGRLDVVVAVDTKTASLVHTADELDRAMPRNAPVVVVELGARIERARDRLKQYCHVTADRAGASVVHAEASRPRVGVRNSEANHG